MKYTAVDQYNQTHRFDLSENDKIGEGATAFVYKIFFQNKQWAAKIYKSGVIINVAKIQAMLDNQPINMIETLDGEDFVQFAWVKYAIRDNSRNIIGFIMSYISHEDTYSLDIFFDPVLSKRLGPKELALSLRIQLAINLCELIQSLHANKNYFIDIKPQNIRVYKKNHKVVLLDCDGYSINNPLGSPKRFKADLISSDYISPEVISKNLKPSDLGLQQDLYGLAVILFQLLNRGTHPFQGIISDDSISATTNDERASLGLYAYGLNKNSRVSPRPQSLHELFLNETRALFDKSFETQRRTTLRTWIEHFTDILENKKLVFCENIEPTGKHDGDLLHIKFVGMKCIGCKLKLESKKPNTNKKIYNVHSIEKSTSAISQGKQSSFSVNYLPPPKPDDFNFGAFFKFSVGSIFILFVLVQIFSNDSKNSNQSSTSTINSNSTQSLNACSIDLKYSTSSQICKYYWSNEVANDYKCNIAIAAELRDRGQYHMPKTSCGKSVLTNSSSSNVSGNRNLIENKNSNQQSKNENEEVKEPQSLTEKFNYIAKQLKTTNISLSSLSNDARSTKYFYEIQSAIVSNLKSSPKTSSDGLVVYSNVNLPYLSSFTMTGHLGDSCTSQSLGRAVVCMVEGMTAQCQFTDSSSIKLYCVETLSK